MAESHKDIFFDFSTMGDVVFLQNVTDLRFETTDHLRKNSNESAFLRASHLQVFIAKSDPTHEELSNGEILRAKTVCGWFPTGSIQNLAGNHDIAKYVTLIKKLDEWAKSSTDRYFFNEQLMIAQKVPTILYGKTQPYIKLNATSIFERRYRVGRFLTNFLKVNPLCIHKISTDRPRCIYFIISFDGLCEIEFKPGWTSLFRGRTRAHVHHFSHEQDGERQIYSERFSGIGRKRKFRMYVHKGEVIRMEMSQPGFGSATATIKTTCISS